MEPTREIWKDWAACMADKERDAETANWWRLIPWLNGQSKEARAAIELQAALIQQHSPLWHQSHQEAQPSLLRGILGALSAGLPH